MGIANDILADASISQLGEKELKQHGVKGQKWGVRRDRPTFSITNGTTGKSVPVEYNPKKTSVTTDEGGKVTVITSSRSEAKKLNTRLAVARDESRRVDIFDLDNNQLQTLITRMNLERQYSQLITSTPAPVKTKRASFARKLLGDIGKEQATKVAKAAASVGVKNALAKGGPNSIKILDELSGGGKKNKGK